MMALEYTFLLELEGVLSKEAQNNPFSPEIDNAPPHCSAGGGGGGGGGQHCW